MSRAGGGWVPDGRAKAIRADCEASLAALDGLADRPLPHPCARSADAVAHLGARAGPAGRRGSRQARRGLERQPSPAGRGARARADHRRPGRAQPLRRRRRSGAEWSSAAPRRASPSSPTRRSGAARAAASRVAGRSSTSLPREARRRGGRARLAARALPRRRRDPRRPPPGDRALRSPRRDAPPRGRRPSVLAGVRRASPGPPARRRAPSDGDVVLVMGIPGAGKSRVAEEYVARGYVRLNRDERGGTLRELAAALDEELSSGARRVVLDNTYLTRAARSYVLDVASRHGIAARCVWLDTPLAQAQVNLVERLLERFGSLPSPEELQELARASRACTRRPPRCARCASSSHRRPTRDSRSVEHVPFARALGGRTRRRVRRGSRARRSPAGRGARAGRPTRAPPRLRLEPAGRARRTRGESRGRWRALCPHPAGPPICWCRPPLPGLLLAFARAHGVDPSRSTLIGAARTPDARDDARRPPPLPLIDTWEVLAIERSGNQTSRPASSEPGDDGLGRGAAGDRLELVHDLGERTPSVDLHRRPGP